MTSRIYASASVPERVKILREAYLKTSRVMMATEKLRLYFIDFSLSAQTSLIRQLHDRLQIS